MNRNTLAELEQSDDLRTRIIANWENMSNLEIAKRVGVNKETVSRRGAKLGLRNKKGTTSGSFKRTRVSEQIVNYRPSPETILEAEARKKTLELGHIKESLKHKNSIKLKVKTDGPNAPDKILVGTVMQKNDNFIAVKLGKYIECFRYTDFFTGRTVII